MKEEKAKKGLVHRVATLEEAVFGFAIKPGSLVNRVAALEEAVFGKAKTKNLVIRVAALEDEIGESPAIMADGGA